MTRAITKIKPGTLLRARAARAGRDPWKVRADIAAGIRHLRAARVFLKFAAPRTAERVRLALTSALGAARNADLAEYREQRRGCREGAGGEA